MDSQTRKFLPAKVTFFPKNYSQTSLYFILLPMIRQICVAVGLTPFILSGTILKLLFAGISTSKIVMRKSTLKISMIPQKSEWLASLEKLL